MSLPDLRHFYGENRSGSSFDLNWSPGSYNSFSDSQSTDMDTEDVDSDGSQDPASEVVAQHSHHHTDHQNLLDHVANIDNGLTNSNEALSEISVADESEKCSICLSAWTTTGNHRICALQCGHLFGYSCVIKCADKNHQTVIKCPECRSKSFVCQIRFIYAKKVTSADNLKIEKLKKELAGARELIQSALNLVAEEKRKRKASEKKLTLKVKALAKLNSNFFG